MSYYLYYSNNKINSSNTIILIKDSGDVNLMVSKVAMLSNQVKNNIILITILL